MWSRVSMNLRFCCHFWGAFRGNLSSNTGLNIRVALCSPVVPVMCLLPALSSASGYTVDALI